jgi:hypothetical protein
MGVRTLSALLAVGLGCTGILTTPEESDGGLLIRDAGARESFPADAGQADAGRVETHPGGATRYPSDRIHSPLTEQVAAHLRSLVATHPDRDPHVVSKFGDVNCATLGQPNWFWGCLDPSAHQPIQWGHQADLSATIAYFAQGRIGGESIFLHNDFPTSCKESGNASVAFSPDSQHPPNGFDYELNLARPRFALVMYGQAETLYGYGEHAWQAELEIIDHLIAQGTIPIVFSPPPIALSNGNPSPAAISRTVDTIIRGLAEARQVPFVSRFTALEHSPSPTAGSHMVAYSSGGAPGARCTVQLPPPVSANCTFTDEALECAYSASVLSALQALDRVKKVIVDQQSPPDLNPGLERRGAGTSTDPFEIDGLPYTQMTDLAQATDLALTDYSGCGGSKAETGNAHVYHLRVSGPTPVRFFGVNAGGSARSLTVHHFFGGLAPGQCLNSTVQGSSFGRGTTLAPGEHYFVVDGAAGAGPAEFLFGAAPCEPGDLGC